MRARHVNANEDGKVAGREPAASLLASAHVQLELCHHGELRETALENYT